MESNHSDKDPQTGHREVLVLLAVVAFGFGVFFGVREAGYAKMSVALGFSIACILVLNLERVAKFRVSGSSLEVETRQLFTRAKDMVEELQHLACIASELMLSLIKRSGRLSGFDDVEEEKARAAIQQTLAKLEITMQRQAEIFREWHQWEEYDYVFYILNAHTIPKGLDQSGIAEWKSIRRDWPDSTEPDQVEAFLRKHRYWNDILKELVDDYKHYRQHHAHRRPEMWHRRQEWGRLSGLGH